MVIAVDLLRIPPLENVHCLMGDFADTELQKKINTIVKDVSIWYSSICW